MDKKEDKPSEFIDYRTKTNRALLKILIAICVTNGLLIYLAYIATLRWLQILKATQ